MTAVYASIDRTQRERGGLLIEATIVSHPMTVAALERAAGASLAEMGREDIAGRLLSVVSAAGRTTLHAIVTGARAALLTAERVFKGLQLEIDVAGGEVQTVTLVDRPLNKYSSASPQTIAVIYKRSEAEMSMTNAIHKYYGTTPGRVVSAAEVSAAWEKMTPAERALITIKSTLAAGPASGGRDFLRWSAARANNGSGNPIRRGGEFK